MRRRVTRPRESPGGEFLASVAQSLQAGAKFIERASNPVELARTSVSRTGDAEPMTVAPGALAAKPREDACRDGVRDGWGVICLSKNCNLAFLKIRIQATVLHGRSATPESPWPGLAVLHTWGQTLTHHLHAGTKKRGRPSKAKSDTPPST